MTQFPQDDDQLVAFLRQHRPIPPLAEEGLEDKIMAWVKHHPHPSSSPKKRPRWSVPSAIAAGLLLAWGGSRIFTPILNYAEEQQELETFMVTTWDKVLGEEAIAPGVETPELLWLSAFEENSQ